MSDDTPALEGDLIPPSRAVQRHYSNAEETALGEQIRLEHEAGERATRQALKHYRKCGDLLAKAKADLGHGLFGRFLSKIGIKPRSAQNYMLLAREFPKLPAEKAQRVADLSLRDALGELARTSGRVAKLPPPAIDRALADARKEPIKVAVTRATNNKVVRAAAAAQPRPVPQPTASLPMPMPIEAIDYVPAAPRQPSRQAPKPLVEPGPDVATFNELVGFLCRVPHERMTPQEACEISDPEMIAAIDRYFEHAIPWIVDFADVWQEQRAGEIKRLTEASALLVDGIVGHVWATRLEQPNLSAGDIRAALNHVRQLLGRGIFNRGDEA